MTEQSPQIIKASTNATTGAASAAVALPVASDGNPARVVRIVVDTGSCWVSFGGSGVTTSGSVGMLITTIPTMVNVEFATYFAHIQNGSASKLCVSPTERYR